MQDGRTPLMAAAADGHDSVISLLLSSGAVVDQADKVNPLFIAVWNRFPHS